MEGKVISFDESKGVGVIQADSGEEVTVHRSAVLDTGSGSLFRGDVVEFRIGRNRWGRRAALEVRRIGWDEEEQDDKPREWTF